MRYKLYAVKGGGSTIVEALFILAEVEYNVEYLPYGSNGIENNGLKSINPLNQVPTLILPDGSIMTESVAIALYLSDIAPNSELVPPAGSPKKAQFLRWITFFGAAIYPTFTFGDFPQRWVRDPSSQDVLTQSTDNHRKMLWQHVEHQTSGGAWFLGQCFTALDVYLSVMTRWRPRRTWFKENCPKLHQIARSVDVLPSLKDVFSRNFDGQPKFDP